MSMENVIDHQSSIDWNLSVKLANNNKVLAKELLEMFMAELPKASGKIHEAYEGNNMNELQTQVHKLHGAACYCGVTKLKDILARMEFTIKERLYDQFSDSLIQFDEEVNSILTAYKFVNYI